MNNMSLAINVTFVGITVVFLALIVLTVIIYYFTKILNTRHKSAKTAKQSGYDEASLLEIDEDDASSHASIPNLDEELIAVITAAIQSSMAVTPGCKLQVKSFRRVGQTTPVWNRTGRLEQIAGKL